MSTADVERRPARAPPRCISMDRRRCTITPDRVDIRPSRASLLLPTAGVFLGLLVVAVVFWQAALPFPLFILLVLVAVALLAGSATGFIYLAVGAHVVVDGAKESAVWQQGLLGIGVGTREVVPFWKIQQVDVEEAAPRHRRGRRQDVTRFEVSLLETSGRRLPVGAVTVPRALAADGLNRARAVAEAIARLADKPVQVAKLRRRRPRVVTPHYIPSRRWR